MPLQPFAQVPTFCTGKHEHLQGLNNFDSSFGLTLAKSIGIGAQTRKETTNEHS